MFLHPALSQLKGLDDAVGVRLAAREDGPALTRLAQLDRSVAAAAELPALAARDEVLVAERDREVIGALSLKDGLVVSDPAHRPTGLAALLRARRRHVKRADARHA
jgi:hypothetical protein